MPIRRTRSPSSTRSLPAAHPTAITFVLKRKDWREKLAEAEAGEVQP
jgi:hypothetical protein